MDYTLTLLRSEIIARDTLALSFTKPKDFIYRAGQSIDLTLTHPENAEKRGETRSCTLASAPYEENLLIAMRIRNTVFKRLLQSLKAGTKVPITGPYGSFVLQSTESAPIVFLTGGIGVTPAYSMIRQALHDKRKQNFYLFDSNHTEDDAPFLAEFTALAADHENFTYIPTMTQADNSWKGKRERIDETLIRSFITDISEPVYYTCGTMSMVYHLRELLKSMGVKPENIRSEDFPGY